MLNDALILLYSSLMSKELTVASSLHRAEGETEKKAKPRSKLAGRREKALAMKVAGHGVVAIAEELGVSIATVSRDINTALAAAAKRDKDGTERKRALTWHRYEDLLRVLWPLRRDNARARSQIMELIRDMRKMQALDKPPTDKPAGELPTGITIQYISMDGKPVEDREIDITQNA